MATYLNYLLRSAKITKQMLSFYFHIQKIKKQ